MLDELDCSRGSGSENDDINDFKLKVHRIQFYLLTVKLSLIHGNALKAKSLWTPVCENVYV